MQMIEQIQEKSEQKLRKCEMQDKIMNDLFNKTDIQHSITLSQYQNKDYLYQIEYLGKECDYLMNENEQLRRECLAQKDEINTKQIQIEDLKVKFKFFKCESEQIKRKICKSLFEIIRNIKEEVKEIRQTTVQQLTSYQSQFNNTLEEQMSIHIQKYELRQILEKEQMTFEFNNNVQELQLLLENKNQECIESKRLHLIGLYKSKEQEAKINQLTEEKVHQIKEVVREKDQIIHDLRNEKDKQINDLKDLKDQKISDITSERDRYVSDIQNIKDILEKKYRDMQCIYEERIQKIKSQMAKISETSIQNESQFQQEHKILSSKYIQSEQQRLQLKTYILKNMDSHNSFLNSTLDSSCAHTHFKHTPPQKSLSLSPNDHIVHHSSKIFSDHKYKSNQTTQLQNISQFISDNI